MKDLVLYIHGKGGSASESAHYRPLFPVHDVLGLDGQARECSRSSQRATKSRVFFGK